MDDFVINVRQVAQYPAVTTIGPNDVTLIQQSGVGGPYRSATPSQFFSGVVGASVGMVTGHPVTGLTTSFVTSLLGARQGYNWYVDQNGIQRYLQGGVAGIWSFGSDGQLAFSIAPSGTADQQMLFNTPLLELASDGQLTLQRQISLGRDPIDPTEATTLQWVQKNTVTSFNGASGDITLSSADINTALNVDPCDAVATQSWVNSTICAAVPAFIYQNPFVYTFNGRVGDICLTSDDITAALTVPGVFASANSPPLGASDGRLATTQFVDESLLDLYDQIESDIGQVIDLSAYAPLASPDFSGIPTAPTANPGTTTGQIATTSFVMNAVAASTAGVSSFNTRTGAVVLNLSDITGAGGAPLASPNLTGTPTAPTALPTTNTTQIATTAFVQSVVTSVSAGVTTFNGRSGAVTLTTADVTGAGGAPIASPGLTGTPTAPTAAPSTNTTQLATTAFVTSAISAAGGVASFNSRTGAVTLQNNDISAAGGALIASPSFTGTPQAPTATAGTSNTQIATTAFVSAAIAASTGGVTTFNGRSGAVTLTTADITGAGGAPIASPGFTGTPTAPTAAQTVNDTTIATCAFVHAALASGVVSSFNSRSGAVTLTGSDISAAGGALIASPTFTGTPAAPTATPGTNTTQLATTAFVTAAVAGGVLSFNGRNGAVTLTTADITGAGGAPVASPALTGTPTTPTATAGTNNTQIASTAFVAAAVGAVAGILAIRVITASGTYTPTAGMKTCLIEAVGGGGGGANASASPSYYVISGGGGGGAYARKFATAAQIGASQTVTIGAGGGVSATGGDTSVGSLLLAKGGSGATGNSPGSSLNGSSGDFVRLGSSGQFGLVLNETYGSIAAGGGGSSALGEGAAQSAWTTTYGAGGNALGYGGGGGGGTIGQTNGAAGGGSGMGGVVIITEFG